LFHAECWLALNAGWRDTSQRYRLLTAILPGESRLKGVTLTARRAESRFNGDSFASLPRFCEHLEALLARFDIF